MNALMFLTPSPLFAPQHTHMHMRAKHVLQDEENTTMLQQQQQQHQAPAVDLPPDARWWMDPVACLQVRPRRPTKDESCVFCLYSSSTTDLADCSTAPLQHTTQHT